MKEVIILILLLLFLNTFLLLKNMNDNSKNSKCQPVEGFFEPANRTMTRVGPYDGITSCSSWGVRNVYDGNRPIGDDAFIFNGPQKNTNSNIKLQPGDGLNIIPNTHYGKFTDVQKKDCDTCLNALSNDNNPAWYNSTLSTPCQYGEMIGGYGPDDKSLIAVKFMENDPNNIYTCNTPGVISYNY